MNLVMTSRGGEITPDIREFLEKKLKRFEKFSKPSANLHVLIVHDRPDRRVEVTVRAYGQELRAEEYGEDLIKCADGALDKLVAQVKKRKDRVTDHSPHKPKPC